MLYKKGLLYIFFACFFMAFFWITGYYILQGIETNASYAANERLNIHHDIIKRDDIDKPKLLVVGGSSVIYGIDNKELSNNLGMPVYNMGSSAGLGLDYLLYDAKKEIKKDDIVLLQLEYPLYGEMPDYSEQKIAIVWDNYDSFYWENLNFKEKMQLIYGISPKLILEKIKTILLGRKNIDQGIEDVKWIDEYGMIQSNTVENSDKKKLLNLIEKKVVNDEILNENKQESIENFLAYCRRKNVEVYVIFPPYLYDKKRFNKEDQKEVQKIKDFWKSNNVKVIGDYTDTLYDIEDFCNSVYHLNTNGREKHTKMLIERLKPYINNN